MLQATYMGYKKQKTAVSSGKETIISMASTAFCLEGSTGERLSYHRAGYHFFRSHPLCQRTGQQSEGCIEKAARRGYREEWSYQLQW